MTRPTIMELKDLANSRGMTIDEIVDPISEKGMVTRDAAIIKLKKIRGMNDGDIANFLNVPVEYVGRVVQ